jgi:HptB-dependent secretion and biofilm anti anti-sigma factor
MEIETKISSDKKIFTISIEGDFNFSLLSLFKQSYSNDAAILADKVIIDFRKTKTIDSSALGMLLNMQKDLGKSDDKTSIINSNEIITKILKITNFSKKFNVVE